MAALAAAADANLRLLGFPQAVAAFLLTAPQNAAEAERAAFAALFHLLRRFDAPSASDMRSAVGLGTAANAAGNVLENSSQPLENWHVSRAQASEFRRRATEMINALLAATADLEPRPTCAQKEHLPMVRIRVFDLQRCTGIRFVRLLWRISSRVVRFVLARSSFFREQHCVLGGSETQNEHWNAALISQLAPGAKGSAGSSREGIISNGVSMFTRACELRARVYREAFNNFGAGASRARDDWKELDHALGSEALQLREKLQMLQRRRQELEGKYTEQMAADRQPDVPVLEQAAHVSRQWELFSRHRQRHQNTRSMLLSAVTEANNRHVLDGNRLRLLVGGYSSDEIPDSLTRQSLQQQQQPVDVTAIITSWQHTCAARWMRELGAGQFDRNSTAGVAIRRLVPQIEADSTAHREQLRQIKALSDHVGAKLQRHLDDALAAEATGGASSSSPPVERSKLSFIPPSPAAPRESESHLEASVQQSDLPAEWTSADPVLEQKWATRWLRNLDAVEVGNDVSFNATFPHESAEIGWSPGTSTVSGPLVSSRSSHGNTLQFDTSSLYPSSFRSTISLHHEDPELILNSSGMLRHTDDDDAGNTEGQLKIDDLEKQSTTVMPLVVSPARTTQCSDTRQVARVDSEYSDKEREFRQSGSSACNFANSVDQSLELGFEESVGESGLTLSASLIASDHAACGSHSQKAPYFIAPDPEDEHQSSLDADVQMNTPALGSTTRRNSISNLDSINDEDGSTTIASSDDEEITIGGGLLLVPVMRSRDASTQKDHSFERMTSSYSRSLSVDQDAVESCARPVDSKTEFAGADEDDDFTQLMVDSRRLSLASGGGDLDFFGEAANTSTFLDSMVGSDGFSLGLGDESDTVELLSGV